MPNRRLFLSGYKLCEYIMHHICRRYSGWLLLANKFILYNKNGKNTADHVPMENHVIDWSDATVKDRECYHTMRQLQESMCIGKKLSCMNRDRQHTVYQQSDWELGLTH